MGGSCGVSKKNLNRVQLPELNSTDYTYQIGKHLIPVDSSPQELERLKVWKDLLPPATSERASFVSLANDTFGFMLLQGRVWECVPSQYRWLSWLALRKQLSFDSNSYASLPLGPTDSVVYKDINRTFPEHPYFISAKSDAQAALSRVLSKYEAAHPKIGYCQGMNYVAGLLLMVSGGNESETYAMFASLLEQNLAQMYAEGMPYLKRVCHAFNLIFAKALPDLYAHLQQEGVPQELWISKWFLTLFALNLPIPVVVRAWDLLIVQGEVALHSIAIGILEFLKPQLLSLDIGGIALAFNSLKDSCPSANQLMEMAFKHRVTPQQLKEYMLESLPIKEEEVLKPLDIVIDANEGEGLLEHLESLTSSVTALPR